MQVVDEADRLLRQAYNEWLLVLNNALAQSRREAVGQQRAGDGVLRGEYAALARAMPGARRLVRILVSATLTKDPTKLAKMDLKFPRCDLHASCMLTAMRFFDLFSLPKGFGMQEVLHSPPTPLSCASTCCHY
jgi:hypothetical protein